MSPLELQEGPQVDAERDHTSRTGCRAADKGLLPLKLATYVPLVDWAGRQQP